MNINFSNTSYSQTFRGINGGNILKRNVYPDRIGDSVEKNIGKLSRRNNKSKILGNKGNMSVEVCKQCKERIMGYIMPDGEGLNSIVKIMGAGRNPY